MASPHPDKNRAAKAGLWSALDLAVRQGLQFGISVALARMLTPGDFGTIAILAFFTSLSTVFVQGGFATALIQRSEITHEEESAVFWCNTLGSAIAAILLWQAGGAIARFYAQPLLEPLMIVAGAQLVLSALGSVQGALLARALRFDLTMITGLVASVASGVVGIAAAFAGWGVWALAAQMLVAAATSTIALWLALPWRPRLSFRPAVLKPLVGFGAWLSMSSMFEVIYSQGAALLVGKVYGVRDLGYYNRALSTQQLPSMILSSVIGRVMLPLFSARSQEPEAIRRALRMAIGLVMFVNVPAMVGLALLARPVMAALFGEQWLPAAPLLAILALSGVLYPLHALNLQALLAHGGSARFFRIEVAKKALGVVFLVVGSFFGVQGLAWAQVVLSVGALHLNAAPMGERVGYGTWPQLRDLSGLLLPLLAMVAVVVALRETIISPFATVAIAAPCGGLTYLAMCALLRVQAFRDSMSILQDFVRGRRPSHAPKPAGVHSEEHPQQPSAAAVDGTVR